MTKRAAILPAGFLGFSAHAQPTAGKTIEGYWQDTARRILFSRDAPPSYVYGKWGTLDQQQTYPSAKRIRRSGAGFEVDDLLYDDEERVQVLSASEDSIESVHHRCGLKKEELLCAWRTTCPKQGLVWEGEQRYARRAACERTASPRGAGHSRRLPLVPRTHLAEHGEQRQVVDRLQNAAHDEGRRHSTHSEHRAGERGAECRSKAARHGSEACRRRSL
jgi:hypothetical protein